MGGVAGEPGAGLFAAAAGEHFCVWVFDFVDYFAVAIERQCDLSGGGDHIGAVGNARLNAVVSL